MGKQTNTEKAGFNESVAFIQKNPLLLSFKIIRTKDFVVSWQHDEQNVLLEKIKERNECGRNGNLFRGRSSGLNGKTIKV